MSKQRTDYFDILRGGGIILVIAIHSFIGFDSIDYNSTNFHVAIIWRQIIGCAVPIFLAISGYFMSQKPLLNRNEYFTGLGIKLGAFIYSITILLWLFSLKTDKTFHSIIWKFFIYLGEISFGIYLTHMFFLTYLVRPFVNQLDLHSYFLNQLLFISLTIISSTSLIYIVRKTNRYLPVKYLGF